MTEMGEKLPAHEKARLEQTLNDLKKALKENSPIEKIRSLHSDLQQAAHSLSEAAYQQTKAGLESRGAGQSSGSDDVVDAETETGFSGGKIMEKKKYHHNTNDTGNDLEEKQNEKMNADIEALQREMKEEKNRHLRTRADFDNFRKRMERESEAKSINAKKEILLDLLTFLDYFDQARKQVQDPAAARGIEIMGRQFNELLYKQGVRPVECLGRPFDPEEQEGLGYMETDQCPEGCVAEEVCSGYKLGDLLLKPAKVMVAKAPE